MIARILLIGSESWVDSGAITRGLAEATRRFPTNVVVQLVRNSYANGAPKLAADVWAGWVKSYPGEYTDAVFIPPGGDITKDIVLAVVFSVGPPSALLLHEVNLLKAARVEIMDYSIPDSGEEAA